MQIQEQRSQRYDRKNRIEYRIRNFFKSKLKNNPFLEKISRDLWRTVYWLYIKANWQVNNLSYYRSDNINIHKLLWIDPNLIQYCSLKEFDINKYKGRVLSGDWDQHTKKFENLDLYLAIKSVCIDGKQWRETEFYNRILLQLNKGKRAWKCIDKSQLDARCEAILLLFEDIRNNGYRTQSEILKQKKIYHPLKNDDEIVISIGRNGDLLFSDGAHRLSIAKLLDIKKIPTKIAVRHRKWCNFRRKLNSYAKDRGGKLYQPIDHPDLNNFPSYHNCYDRFIIIKRNIYLEKGLILDIGANLGYFSGKFEEEGFSCYAVEKSKSNSYLMEKIKRSQNKTFKIINKSIFDSEEVLKIKYDIVFALNIFHHFLKTEHNYKRFVSFLHNLKTQQMIFEPHLYHEIEKINPYRNYNPNEFVSFILRNSSLNHQKYIGAADDGRRLYKLYV